MSLSYKPEVRTGADPKFYANALVFATYAEAWHSASDLADRWMLVVDFRVAESDEPVNAAIVDGKLTSVRETA
ncbi:MAG: hypothetical protein HQ445_09055 [Polaromonas sp.]|nr:hypothetical protein [Polaromonas sp.]